MMTQWVIQGVYNPVPVCDNMPVNICDAACQKGDFGTECFQEIGENR